MVENELLVILEQGWWRMSCVIQGKLARNQVEFIKYCGITDELVPNKQLTLREIVRDQSLCGGQGFTKCNCQKGNCSTSRCSCFKNSLHCNSSCHGNRSCKNVD